jgi:hypothetical protein
MNNIWKYILQIMTIQLFGFFHKIFRCIIEGFCLFIFVSSLVLIYFKQKFIYYFKFFTKHYFSIIFFSSMDISLSFLIIIIFSTTNDFSISNCNKSFKITFIDFNFLDSEKSIV